MNKPATLTPKAPLLMLASRRWRFQPHSTPVLRRLFSITPSSKLSKLKRKKRKSSAATAKQASDARQNADNKKTTANNAQLQKRIASQQATIAQKDKIIQQLKNSLPPHQPRIHPLRMSKRR
ncbi:hypothetical protein LNP17_05485 [Klebsiella variicola subsp. variicola]|nr:hypothetical protein [Klebsiella variicola subsp. variicola]